MLSVLQQVLVSALGEADPAGSLRRAVADRGLALDDRERQWLAAVDPDGLQLTRVLVRKLRIQRLIRGDAEMRALFTADPAAFAERYVAYEAGVPAQAVTPGEEAAAFAAFEAMRSRG